MKMVSDVFPVARSPHMYFITAFFLKYNDYMRSLETLVYTFMYPAVKGVLVMGPPTVRSM